jgi:DNA topoisomerase-1
MIKLGRYGKFLSCANYPECKGTRQIDGTERPEPTPVEGTCELCGSPLLQRHGRFGPFIGCSDYPKCKYIKKETIGGHCPKCRTGKLQQRRSKKRRSTFYGCTRYPDCDYVMGTRPLDDPCPKCGGTMAPDDERGGICQSCGHALQGDPVPPPVAPRSSEAEPGVAEGPEASSS